MRPFNPEPPGAIFVVPLVMSLLFMGRIGYDALKTARPWIVHTLIGYDGWLWRAESGKTHLDSEPPGYRREPDGLLMVRTENGWDRCQEKFLNDGLAKDIVSVGPIVPFGVGLLRRWREWRNPKLYEMQYFNTHRIVRVTTRDGEVFRIGSDYGQAAIEGSPELIMSVLMRHIGEDNTERMIREPERVEAWYRVLVYAVQELDETLQDRSRVSKSKVSVGKVRCYLDGLGHCFKRQRPWREATPIASTGPSPGCFADHLGELFPPKIERTDSFAPSR
ncbi:MAG: hypothetical protein ABIH67_04215 [Candidatus Uhrbacteria bacterium]